MRSTIQRNVRNVGSVENVGNVGSVENVGSTGVVATGVWVRVHKMEAGQQTLINC